MPLTWPLLRLTSSHVVYAQPPFSSGKDCVREPRVSPVGDGGGGEAGALVSWRSTRRHRDARTAGRTGHSLVLHGEAVPGSAGEASWCTPTLLSRWSEKQAPGRIVEPRPTPGLLGRICLKHSGLSITVV